MLLRQNPQVRFAEPEVFFGAETTGAGVWTATWATGSGDGARGGCRVMNQNTGEG